ncbi:MAG TPA: hypothetical protein IAA30_01465 [Candidatus Treponema faecavium]|nr:hypothetical protein [Candidatus Treponema faecavium]
MSTAAASPAAQIILAVIPIVGIVIGGIVVFFYLLWRHREITLQIRTGCYIQRSINLKLYALLTGLLLTGVGAVLTILFLLLNGISYTVLGGLIPLALGICLLIFYRLYPQEHDAAAQVP